MKRHRFADDSRVAGTTAPQKDRLAAQLSESEAQRVCLESDEASLHAQLQDTLDSRDAQVARRTELDD